MVERDAIRYTPAGIPLIDCKLRHISEQSEAGQVRQVEFEIAAIGIGSIAKRLEQSRLDRAYRFAGFLANRSRKSKRSIFHIVDFESTRKD